MREKRPNYVSAVGLCLLLACCTEPAAPQIDGSSSAASSSSSASAAPAVNETGLPLTVAPGLRLAIAADDLSGARDIVQDGMGNLWVSRPEAGVVTLLTMQSGAVLHASDVLQGLRRPHGLLIDPDDPLVLYVAEETRIIRARLYTDAPLETVATLPAGGRHRTRTMEWGTDGRIYVSIGSTCDTCVEENELHGSVLSFLPDGTDRHIEARGLRNAVFLERHPATGAIWATEMGRDFLGDDLPPDEVNVLERGAHYGWPFCYGDGVRDETFQPEHPFSCVDTEPPRVRLPAHVAPLDLAFVPDGWPEEWQGDLLVALHGSWNSTRRVGYKIIRIPLDANGLPAGDPVDVVDWLHDNRVLGRPAGLLFTDDGSLFITDDDTGRLYRLVPQE